eukprot:CAMPEP_0204174708 /NCGR_PEP_ID=MMETSP0361-20130328/46109_1 /ASSEMBLY_ACC=CAM_ASM_000343 /TAXON_ID=268821 /ORGANISM="Scrippsiella Hangoei, Strain SHTV-5" /LENGTH=95 /DNA_ID=CAMNT_0051133237 /DNA_START=164 /DNA_END=447 /DNA_ORIENTATION=+
MRVRAFSAWLGAGALGFSMKSTAEPCVAWSSLGTWWPSCLTATNESRSSEAAQSVAWQQGEWRTLQGGLTWLAITATRCKATDIALQMARPGLRG